MKIYILQTRPAFSMNVSTSCPGERHLSPSIRGDAKFHLPPDSGTSIVRPARAVKSWDVNSHHNKTALNDVQDNYV